MQTFSKAFTQHSLLHPGSLRIVAPVLLALFVDTSLDVVFAGAVLQANAGLSLRPIQSRGETATFQSIEKEEVESP